MATDLIMGMLVRGHSNDSHPLASVLYGYTFSTSPHVSKS